VSWPWSAGCCTWPRQSSSVAWCYLFFSFTTLTTTGYGNLVPAANPGQTFAVLEMLTGQLFLVTAVAKVVSTWRPSQGRGRPPTDNDSD
jgi:hypothetical protein